MLPYGDEALDRSDWLMYVCLKEERKWGKVFAGGDGGTTNLLLLSPLKGPIME